MNVLGTYFIKRFFIKDAIWDSAKHIHFKMWRQPLALGSVLSTSYEKRTDVVLDTHPLNKEIELR